MFNPTPSFSSVVPGLYCYPAGSPGRAVRIYFLTETDASPSVEPTLAQMWGTGWDGWLIFLPCDITQPAAFVTAARAGLAPLGSTRLLNRRGIVWLPGESAFDRAQTLLTYQPVPQRQVRAFTGAMQLSIGPLDLVIASGSGAALTLDTGTGVFNITGPSGPNYISIPALGNPQFYSGQGWSLNLTLDGEAAGALTQTAAFDFGQMTQSMGCAIRYVRGSGLQTLSYPIFATPAPQRYRGMQMALNPVFPEDPAQSSFLFDFSSAVPQSFANGDLTSDSFRTVNGSAVVLAPSQDSTLPMAERPGFALCKGPSSQSPGPEGYSYYLSPIGRYEVCAIDRGGGSPDSAGGQSIMLGLSGQEYLGVAIGQHISLVAGFPAFAADGKGSPPASGAPSPGSNRALRDDYTTSWVVPPGGSASGAQVYFGQADASTYYLGQDQYGLAPPAVSRLAIFDTCPPVPMAPYGRVFQSGINSGALPTDFEQMEGAALSKDRHAILTLGQGGPTFTAHGCVVAPMAGETHNAALTPQGFVADLNADGSWARVSFARSPDPGHEQQYLSFTGTGSPAAVAPALATTLLQSQLFLVVSNGAALGTFETELALAGFNFVLDVGSTGPVSDQDTVLIFKYNTALSLAELAQSPMHWAESDTFVRDMAGTQLLIATAIAEANSKTASHRSDELATAFVLGPKAIAPGPLANFARIAADPKWTGVIALNARIDANGMPADLQMLLGGINGALRAHHFGVASSQIDTSDGAVTIKQSSLFGVIDYPSASHPLPPVDTRDAFDYEVKKLEVVFSNSKISVFNVQVGLTVNQLFGRNVALRSGTPVLSPPDNELVIAGRYQLQNGVGAVTFATETPFVYEVPVPEGTSRVIEKLVFDRASLVPVSDEPLASPATGTKVHCRFNLSGALWFSPQPFQSAPGLDLFSYGTSTAGQGFSGLAVDIRFELDGEGALAPGSKTVTGTLEALSLTPSTDAARDGSLMHNLPLKISRFLSDPKGLTASSLGASPVHVAQLEPQMTLVPSPGPSPQGSPGFQPLLTPSGPAPNVTAKPQFALEFDMPLGSLGALSNVHAGLIAKLILGWGPSTVVPGSDAAAVMVQLPSAFAGYGGFELQGILKTIFGDANLLKVDLDSGPVYAVLFGNIQLSLFGYNFPPGLAVDFLLFAGDAATSNGGSNIAWFLGAKPTKKKATSP
jgi:hypothetical protein